MAQELGARLVRAGLVTRAQLGDALQAGSVEGSALVLHLVSRGLLDDALAAFFLTEGHGPLLDAAALAAADEQVVRRLPATTAASLVALPVRESPAGLVVAMADPTDRHAAQEIEFSLRSKVQPAVARVTDLLQALRAAHPGLQIGLPRRSNTAPMEPVLTPAAEPQDEAPVVELVRKRPAAKTLRPGDWGSSTSREERSEAGAKLAPRTEPEEDVVPLVRHKPLAAAPSKAAPKDVGGFSRPTTQEFAAPAPPATTSPDSTTIPASQRETGATGTPPKHEVAPSLRPAPSHEALTVTPPLAPYEPSATSSLAPPSSAGGWAAPTSVRPSSAGAWGAASARPPSEPDGTDPPPEETWGDLTRASLPPLERTSSIPPAPSMPAAKLAPAARRRLERPSRAPSGPVGIGVQLAALRLARDRDEAVHHALDAALTVCRCALFLALRKDVLHGRDCLGGGVSREGVRNLWIPVASQSVLKAVVERGTPYRGPHGTSAADAIFRAAINSRGGELLAQPVRVSGRVVGVLCADGLEHGELGRERIDVLAQCISDAFERVIMSTKKSPS